MEICKWLYSKNSDIQGEAKIMNTKETLIIMHLKKALLSTSTFEKKFTILYEITSVLMKHIFSTKKERLPKALLYACVVHIIGVMRMSNGAMRPLLLVMRKEYTIYNHSVNVAFMASLMGKEMDYTHEQLIELTYAALLHDIGNIRLENNLLEKTSSLSHDEFELIKYHTEYGYSILKQNGIRNFTILSAVLLHHEKLDGSGYPKGFHGNKIPSLAQIIGVIDIFNALVSKRTFRESYTSYDALMIMKHEMDHQIDHRIVDLLITMLACCKQAHAQVI